MSAESNIRWSDRVSSCRIALAMVFGKAMPSAAGGEFPIRRYFVARQSLAQDCRKLDGLKPSSFARL